jgi:deoxycytidylate deaminase
MANTNAQAIAFSNTRIRPMADQLYSTYLSAKKLASEWNAQSVSTVIPNDSTVISDGAATDGRPQITDAQATNIVTRCNEMISWMENGLVASPFGTSATLATLNTIVAAEVNGTSKF